MQSQGMSPVNSSYVKLSLQPVGCSHKTSFGEVRPKTLTSHKNIILPPIFRNKVSFDPEPRGESNEPLQCEIKTSSKDLCHFNQFWSNWAKKFLPNHKSGILASIFTNKASFYPKSRIESDDLIGPIECKRLTKL